jgi:hypothetical protein
VAGGGPGVRLALAGAALLLAILSLEALWPGYALYDTVGQFRQALSGEYDDWHPPIMARLWTLLHGQFGGTGAPMLALQLGLYWLGFGLVAEALAATRCWASAIAVLLLAASPLLLGWQGAILKDAQMLGALLAGFGIVAAYRLRDRRIPLLATLIVAILFGYALLVRANALFAVVPLIVFLAPRPAGFIAKLLLIMPLSLGAIAAEPWINHHLLHARSTGVEKTQPLYDLAAIGIANPIGSPFTPAELATFRTKDCVKVYFWDPLGDEVACGRQVSRLQGGTEAGQLYRLWMAQIIAHPISYFRHRLGHWNSTSRWLIPPGRLGAEPPANSELNDLGLVEPISLIAKQIQHGGAIESGTPLGWPILWLAIALMTAPLAWSRRNDPAAGLTVSLCVSSIGLEASFFVVSIASDLRYHLWSMTASALALILIADGTPVKRGRVVLAALILAAIIAAGIYSRNTLPFAPATYRAMIDSRTG